MAQYIEHNPSVQDDFKSWLKSWRLELERADTNTNADNTKEGHAMIPTGDIPDQHFDNGDDVDKDGVSIPNMIKKPAAKEKLRRRMTLDMRNYHHDRIEERTKLKSPDDEDDTKAASDDDNSNHSDFKLDTTRICSMMGWAIGIHAPAWIAILQYFDKVFPGKMTPKSLVARVGFTAMCALPFNAAFFTYATCSHLVLEEMNMRRNARTSYTCSSPAHNPRDVSVMLRLMAAETKLKLKREYFLTVIDSYQLWVPFNTINFAFVPPHLRMIALSLTTVFWNCYLSLAQHRDIPLPDIDYYGSSSSAGTCIAGNGGSERRLVG